MNRISTAQAFEPPLHPLQTPQSERLESEWQLTTEHGLDRGGGDSTTCAAAGSTAELGAARGGRAASSCRSRWTAARPGCRRAAAAASSSPARRRATAEAVFFFKQKTAYEI